MGRQELWVELAAVTARGGARRLDLDEDEAEPDGSGDEVVRALDTVHLLIAGGGREARVEAIRRLVRADEVRIEAAPLLDRGPEPGDGPWLAVVPHDHDGVQEVAVLTRWGPRFTAAEVARCRAVLRLAAQLQAGAQRRPSTTLERLVVLADGGLVRLRHLGPGDRDAVEAHRSRCSFAVPTVDDLLRFDGCDHVRLAALIGTDIVGVGRSHRHPVGRDRERTVSVEDRHQRRGIGTLLATELARLAAGRG